LTTQPEAMREQGFDPRQMVEEIAEFNKLLDEQGVVLDTDPRRVSKQGQGQGESIPTGLNNATDKTDS
jgi:capsid protein